MVLALVVNPEGFLKFSSVFEGNKADSKSLPDIVDGLHKQTAFGDQMPTVIMDAGISTKENLLLLTKKGYKYVCVSRTQLKDYEEVKGANPKTIVTKNKQELTLQRVTAKDKTDYYLKVYSPGKQLKEASMKNSFENKLEAELQKAASALTKRGGIKKVEPVNRRIGKIIKTYPSASKYYTITVDADKKSGIVSSIKWAKQPEKHEVAEENLGVYFIQTNIPIDNECHLWQTYNTIRNIESCFRCLKSDLAIRPLHHRTDTNTMAHIHLALLAYWVVNTIRYQLKPRGISSDWTEIVRIGNTQKIITTTGQNQYGDSIAVRKCSQPNKSLKLIYDALRYKSTPFTKRKSIVHKLET